MGGSVTLGYVCCFFAGSHLISFQVDESLSTLSGAHTMHIEAMDSLLDFS